MKVCYIFHDLKEMQKFLMKKGNSAHFDSSIINFAKKCYAYFEDGEFIGWCFYKRDTCKPNPCCYCRFVQKDCVLVYMNRSEKLERLLR